MKRHPHVKPMVFSIPNYQSRWKELAEELQKDFEMMGFLTLRLAGNILDSIKTSLTETMVSATKLVRIQCYYTRMGQKFDTLKLMSACSGFNRLLATGIYIYTLCIYIYTHIIICG